MNPVLELLMSQLVGAEGLINLTESVVNEADTHDFPIIALVKSSIYLAWKKAARRGCQWL